jgi:hypothetical protein
MTASQTVHGAPVLQGWITSHRDGIYIAERVRPLSDYQALYGCKTQVTAPTAAELDWLCVAERVHAELVANAERQAVTPQLPPYDQVPISKTLLALDRPGSPDGG